MYPVDSIYISTNSTSPASLYGGSWERYGTGRALISASDTDNDFKAGTTGGSITPTGIRIMVSYLDQTGLEHTLEKLRNQMYPVGSLYFSTNSTSPATIYGGTWERYGKGRTLVSVDESDTDFTAGKTGGEKTHQHEYGWVVCDYYSSPLITPGSKNRTHSDSGLLSWDNEGHPQDKDWFFSWTQAQHAGNMERNGSLATSVGAYVTNAIRYVQTAITNISSNVQPYISVYVWRRTA